MDEFHPPPLHKMNTTPPRAFQALQEAERGLQALKEAGLIRKQRLSQSACATEQMFNGRAYKTFCSNDYLGLANHPAVVQAAQDALGQFGLGSGASHLISGHHQAHERLAERLSSFQAAHIPHVQTLTFSTGYMANLGVITALASLSKVAGQATDEGTSIYSARLNHASIVDGIRLASRQSRLKLTLFDTEDLQSLETQLMADPMGHKLIVCDGVFSMDGHLSPVTALLDLAIRCDALLLIDDAHGFGVLGEKGHGLLEHLSLNSERLIYMGTLSKAAGGFGAFVCAHQSLCAWLFQKARSYIYTTALPPSIAAAALQSLDIIEGHEGQTKRAHLNGLIACWQDTLQLKHWSKVGSNTPIQPVVVGKNELCLQLDQTLQSMGYLIPAIRPPTVPLHTARLRITFSANHSTEEVQSLAHVLMDLENQVMHP